MMRSRFRFRSLDSAHPSWRAMAFQVRRSTSVDVTFHIPFAHACSLYLLCMSVVIDSPDIVMVMFCLDCREHEAVGQEAEKPLGADWWDNSNKSRGCARRLDPSRGFPLDALQLGLVLLEVSTIRLLCCTVR